METFIDANRCHVNRLRKKNNNSIISDYANLENDYISEINCSYLPYEYSKVLKKNAGQRRHDGRKSLSSFMDDSGLCLAEKYTLCIVDCLNNYNFSFDSKGRLNDSFYSLTSSMFSKKCKFDFDKEMLVIYAKQLIMMLKHSGIISTSEGNSLVKIKSQFKHNLFNTFWNLISWSELFPSMPLFANQMKENKNIIKDLLSERNGAFLLDDFVKDYLIITELNLKNELLKISFFDFSLFSWLNLFDVINYVSYPSDSSIYVEVTDEGRNFINEF